MTTIREGWLDRLVGYKEHRGILRFADEELGLELDPWQEETLLAFESPAKDKRRISLQACAGPGKSAVLTWCGWWFLATQGEKGEHPKGLATSITSENLKDNLWSEYAKWQARSEYLRSQFTWTSKRIFANDHPETWFIGARSWPKTANADEQGKTFSGLHAKYILCQVDESGAVPTTVLRAAEQALSRCRFGKIIQAGNPISLEGMLFAAANELTHLWYVVIITGDPDDRRSWVNAPRVIREAADATESPREWAAQQIATYGRENPWVKAYILGKFPPSSINSVFGHEEVLEAMARKYAPDDYAHAQKRLGVDVARFGDDRTIIAGRQGLVCFPYVTMRNERTTAIAARVARIATRWGAELIFVDDTGHWGHGVIDNLTTASFPTHPVIYNDRAISKRYKNRRAEMWLEFAEWVKSGGALPHDKGLLQELTAVTYTFIGGQFVLEEKDQVKARIGRSPDAGDAYAQTFALPDMPTEALARMRGPQRAATRFDPIEQYARSEEERLDLHGHPDAGGSGVGRVQVDFDPYEH